MAQLTQIEAAHEGYLGINQAQLLVVCPIQDHIVARAIERLQSVAAELGQVEGVQGQVLEPLLEVCLEVMAAGQVVGMPEDLDVGV